VSAWSACDDSPALPAAPRERDTDYHVEELVRARVAVVRPAPATRDDKEAA